MALPVQRAIGLAALTVLELPPPEQISAAAAAGYTHVGLRLIPVGNQVLPPFDERETARRLADTGVRVLDVEVFRLAPETKVADFEPVIATAARLRATDLLVHGADPDEARLAESFARLCDLAARALPGDLPISVEVPYAKPMSAPERAKRALSATRKLLRELQ